MLLWLLTVAGAPAHAADVKPIVVKVIVVTTFEVGADTGDQPGEFQYWAERKQWDRKVMVPGMVHPVYVSDKGELAVVSGATARCAEQILALAVDPRFDFTHAYWMLAGIAGANPSVASVASFRATYKGYPNALKPPFVLAGDVLGSNRYWHEATMAHWAEDWTKTWTNRAGACG
jgi:purine nucleoside permease